MNKNDLKKLIRLGIYFALFVASSIYYFFKDSNEQQYMEQMFSNTVFGIEEVTTKLLNYKVNQDSIFIRIEARGLPEKAANYKPVVLAYICSEKTLRNALRSGKLINFDMSAPDREDGNHMNIRINFDRCS